MVALRFQVGQRTRRAFVLPLALALACLPTPGLLVCGACFTSCGGLGLANVLRLALTRRRHRRCPYHVNSLGDEFRKWADAAGLPQCSIYGLRKAGCRRLAEAGVSAPDIMAVSGHRTLAMAQKYVEASNRERGAERAIAKLQEARMAQ